MEHGKPNTLFTHNGEEESYKDKWFQGKKFTTLMNFKPKRRAEIDLTSRGQARDQKANARLNRLDRD